MKIFPHIPQSLLLIAHLKEKKNLILSVSSSSGPKQQSSLLLRPSSLSSSAAPECIKQNEGRTEMNVRIKREKACEKCHQIQECRVPV